MARTRRPLASLLVALLAAAALEGAARTARADDKRACLDAYVNVQRARNEGALRRARAAAIVCARDACPERLRADCVEWLRELDENVPTVVISVVDAAGGSLPEARVDLDGVRVDGLGRAVEVDPGAHLLRATLPGRPLVERRLVVSQGERSRAVRLVLGGPIEPVTTDAEPASSVGGSRPITPATYIASGVSLVGFGVWAAFGLSALYGSPSVSTLDACSPNCARDDVDRVNRALDIAGVGAGVGVVGLGIATYLYLTRPTVASPARAATGPVLSPTPNGVSLGVRGTF